MKNKEEIKELTGKEKRLANLRPCKPGETHNPKGRPLGQKNYETLRREAIISYAKRNGKTPEEVEILIYEQGVNQAIKGEFNFYRDHLDRAHGKASENLNIKSESIITIDVETRNKVKNAIKGII